MFFLIVASGKDLSFAATRVLGRLVFSLGLTLVTVGGADPFTGNNLVLLCWTSREVSTAKMLGIWGTIYLGNFVGALGRVALVFLSRHTQMNGGRIAVAVLNTAVAKIEPDSVSLFFKRALRNLLVCLAVWLAYAGRSVTDKIVALILPVSAFVAVGFEHCVDDMCFLPLTWVLTQTRRSPAGFDVSAIAISGIAHNFVPVTLGNIFGGAGLVGTVHWVIYRAAVGAGHPQHGAERR